MTRKVLVGLLALALLMGATGLALADEHDSEDDAGERRGPPEGRGKPADAGAEAKERGRGERGGGDDDRERGPPEFGKKGSKYLLQNDQIAVWFHANPAGKAKPDLRITFPGAEGNESGYRVKILRLYEAPPEDPHFRGYYPKINLAKADDWNLETQQSNESITLTMVRAERQGIVTLVWHIDTVNASVKYDVKVDNWQWGNTSHQLVLDMVVMGKNLQNETGASMRVEESGYISWETVAHATYAENDTRNLTVQAYRQVENGEGDEGEGIDEKEGKGSHILLVFEGEGGYQNLDYDPVFGIQSSGARTLDVPALAPTAGLLAVACVAFALRRRRA